ncbi:hypothetical protein BgiMline_011662 [Biomphalaria glabrata]
MQRENNKEPARHAEGLNPERKKKRFEEKQQSTCSASTANKVSGEEEKVNNIVTGNNQTNTGNWLIDFRFGCSLPSLNRSSVTRHLIAISQVAKCRSEEVSSYRFRSVGDKLVNLWLKNSNNNTFFYVMEVKNNLISVQLQDGLQSRQQGKAGSVAELPAFILNYL